MGTKFNENMAAGVYEPTDEFKNIDKMSCVCDAKTLDLIAVTGPAGDKESEDYADLFSISPLLLETLKTIFKLESLTKDDPEYFYYLKKKIELSDLVVDVVNSL